MLEIQQLNTDEWKRLRKIRLAALSDDPYAFGSTFQETTVRPNADWTAQIISLPTFVAVLHGLDSGIVRCSPRPNSEDIADLISMWVAPSARGEGVGEALIDAVIDWGRSEGYARLLLDVSEENGFAIALYKRKGSRQQTKPVISRCQDSTFRSMKWRWIYKAANGSVFPAYSGVVAQIGVTPSKHLVVSVSLCKIRCQHLRSKGTLACHRASQ